MPGTLLGRQSSVTKATPRSMSVKATAPSSNKCSPPTTQKSVSRHKDLHPILALKISLLKPGLPFSRTQQNELAKALNRWLLSLLKVTLLHTAPRKHNERWTVFLARICSGCQLRVQ